VQHDGAPAIHLEDAAAAATQLQFLLHRPARHGGHGGGHEQSIAGRVAGCVAVGGVFAVPGEQDVALVQPRIPEAVQDQDGPVHRAIRQVDVEAVAAGQPVARHGKQLVSAGQQTGERSTR